MKEEKKNRVRVEKTKEGRRERDKRILLGERRRRKTIE